MCNKEADFKNEKLIVEWELDGKKIKTESTFHKITIKEITPYFKTINKNLKERYKNNGVLYNVSDIFFDKDKVEIALSIASGELYGGLMTQGGEKTGGIKLFDITGIAAECNDYKETYIDLPEEKKEIIDTFINYTLTTIVPENELELPVKYITHSIK